MRVKRRPTTAGAFRAIQHIMDFQNLIERKRERFAELEREMADSALFENRKRASEIMREHSALKTLLALATELETARRQLEDNRELATADDAEMAQMAKEEIPELEKRVAELERDFQIALLPPDENENRDAIVEIRAGTGGSEAAIFAADLYRMYNRYAEANGLEDGRPGVESVGARRIARSDLQGLGRERVSEAAVRERRASRAACAGDRSAGPHSHFDCDGRGACRRRRKSTSI